MKVMATVSNGNGIGSGINDGDDDDDDDRMMTTTIDVGMMTARMINNRHCLKPCSHFAIDCH